MKNKRLCCRIYPIVLFSISLVLASAIWYFQKGVKQLISFNNWDELINFFGAALFISVVPIGLFYYLVEKESYESKAKQLALLGFLPTLIVLVVILT